MKLSPPSIAFARSALATLAMIASAPPSHSHEFWIDPVSATVAVGEPIVAVTRVGQTFEGNSYSYVPENFRLFEIAQGGMRVPVEGLIGDRPSLDQAAPGEGLAVILHVTRDYTLTYDEPDKFRDFVTHKDARWVLDAHAERGLPDADFSEAYSRYAKALVAVGEGEGEDSTFGLLTEITALANPYTDDVSGGLPVRLAYDGAPRAGAQIEVFEKGENGAVEVFTVRTDDAGEATVPVKPGRRYMLDAVVLREPAEALAQETGVVWESLWANLTFTVPGR